MKLQAALFVVVLGVLVAAEEKKLKCYSCTEKCQGLDRSPWKEKECDANAKSCEHVVTRVKGVTPEKSKYTVRADCSDQVVPAGKKYTCEKKEETTVTTTTCYCVDDLCNASVTFRPSLLLLVMACAACFLAVKN